MISNEKINIKENIASKLQNEIIQVISQETRTVLIKAQICKMEHVEEIRLRAGKPLMVQNFKEDWLVNTDGSLSRSPDNAFIVSQEEVIKTLELMSHNSIYAYQEDIKNGFITLKGGHRIGISGKVVIENGNVRNIHNISGLNIRISCEILNCSAHLIKHMINKNEVYNTLVISPPQCGKTTILRDIARVLSDGIEEAKFHGVKVGIIDERSEIAACFKGVPQNRVGIRTDVLDGCPKSLGMVMMLRSMSPQVIITDEIGSKGDREALMNVLNAGIKIITSAHGYNISELKSRQEVLKMIENKLFERYIVLSNKNGPGTLEEVIDGSNMKTLYRRDEHVA